jgi:hypothetical protein
MSSKSRRYEVLLPVRFNDGQDILRFSCDCFVHLVSPFLINVSGADRVSVAGYSIGDHLWSSNHSRRDNYV